jgi:HSP20 family protein
MNEQNQATATTTKTDEKALTTTTNQNDEKNGSAPFLVEGEKMLEHFAALTKETAQKAYEFFQKRGGEIGKELDDWFKAESEILLPVPVDITETAEQFNVRAAIPGFKPEEIEVSVKDKLLILSGKTEMREKKEGENTVYSEWRSNRFFRQLPLSSEVNAEKVEATLKDGVLMLTLPKLPAREPKHIAVNAG